MRVVGYWMTLGLSMALLPAPGRSEKDSNQLSPRQLFYGVAPSQTSARKAGKTAGKPADKSSAKSGKAGSKDGGQTAGKPGSLGTNPSEKETAFNSGPRSTGTEQEKAPEPGQAVTAPRLGIRYSILQLSGDKLEEVDPEKVFRSGDRVQLKVESNEGGYLYLVLCGSEGEWKLLFPSSKIADGDNRVRARTPLTVPGGDERDFVFDDKPGTEMIYLVLSKQPEPDLDLLIYSLQQSGGGVRTLRADNRFKIPEQPLERMRLASRGMAVESRRTSVRLPDRERENAVYVVVADLRNSRVVTEIPLKHR